MSDKAEPETNLDLEKLAILKEAVMDKDNGPWKDPVILMKEIESRMDEYFSSRKDEIERELAAKIANEKREAELRIENVSQEFGRIKAALSDHKNVISGLQASRDDIYERIRDHFNKAVSHRNSFKMTLNQAAEELGMIGELKQELSRLDSRAEKEASAVRIYLDKMGVSIDLPGIITIEDPAPDYERELLKIRNIREILASGTPEPPAEEAGPATGKPVMVGFEAPVSGPDEQPTASPEPEKGEPASPAPAPDTVPAGPEPVEDPAVLLGELLPFERTESAGNGTTLTFYEGRKAKVIDVVSLLQAMDKVSEEASDLHDVLAKTSSIKDLFLTKQEILNKQEVLRKAFYLSVKYCDKEGGALPAFVSGVFSVDMMKDALERLTLGNWSDLTDFQIFNTDSSAIFDDLRTRLAAYPAYLKSILVQIS